MCQNDIKIYFPELGCEYTFRGRILNNIILQVLEEDFGLLLTGVSFQGSSECDNLLLALPSPEYPFGEASSSPLDDRCAKLKGESAQKT